MRTVVGFIIGLVAIIALFSIFHIGGFDISKVLQPSNEWCVGPGCVQSQNTSQQAQASASSTITFGETNDYASAGSLDIVVVGEGSVTPATVPYGSLVSTWDGNKRSDALILCSNDLGCFIPDRGDYRTYQFSDGTNVPRETLISWVQSQLGAFPFAKSIQEWVSS